MARARGLAGILLGTEKAPRANKDIDRKKEGHSFELRETEKKRRKDSYRQMAMHT